MSHPEAAETAARGPLVQTESQEWRYLQTLWAAVSNVAAATPQQSSPPSRYGQHTPLRGAPIGQMQQDVLMHPMSVGQRRHFERNSGAAQFSAEQHMTRMLESSARPRATATPQRPKDSLHSVRAVTEHPKWATSALATTFAFVGGAIGVKAAVLSKDIESTEVDATRLMNEFFKKGRALSTHMAERFAYMTQLLSENAVKHALPHRGHSEHSAHSLHTVAGLPRHASLQGSVGYPTPAYGVTVLPEDAVSMTMGLTSPGYSGYPLSPPPPGGVGRGMPGTPEYGGGGGSPTSTVGTLGGVPQYSFGGGGGVVVHGGTPLSPPSPADYRNGALFSPTDSAESLDRSVHNSPRRQQQLVV